MLLFFTCCESTLGYLRYEPVALLSLTLQKGLGDTEKNDLLTSAPPLQTRKADITTGRGVLKTCVFDI